MNKVESNKVSIIVPVFNGEKYLEKTLESILASTYKNIEILLVDDGSTDKSQKICNDYVHKDNRVKVIYKKNGGIVEARNLGITQATGEYLCFCDQDDIINAKMYYKMLKRMQEDASEICICSTNRILDNQIIPYEKLEDALYEDDKILENVLYPILFNGYNVSYKNKKVKIYGTIWKYMVSRNLVMKYNLKFKKFINYEDDLIMSIELLTLAKKVTTLSDALYFWRINRESESNRGKYIKNLEFKMKEFDRYVIKNLTKRKVNNELIDKYIEIKECNNYLQIIQNENYTRKKTKEKVQTLVCYINNTNINKNLKNLELIQDGYIRFKILLKLIDYRLYRVAILSDKLLKNLNLLILNFEWLAKLERQIKGIRLN